MTLTKNVQIQIFLLTFPVCVPNTGDNDVMYLTRIKLSSKTEKETVLGTDSSSKLM